MYDENKNEYMMPYEDTGNQPYNDGVYYDHHNYYEDYEYHEPNLPHEAHMPYGHHDPNTFMPHEPYGMGCPWMDPRFLNCLKLCLSRCR